MSESRGERLTLRHDARFRRRRRVALVVGILLIVGTTNGITRVIGSYQDARQQDTALAAELGGTSPSTPGRGARTPATPSRPTTSAPSGAGGTDPWVKRSGDLLPSAQTGLEQVERLYSDVMSPKSVVASHDGQVYAQNMMYHHSVSVLDARGTAVATIPDTVDLDDFGVDGHGSESQGAPVEMAFSADGRTAWVSNYSMYGAGFGPEGLDSCTPDDNTSESFLYKIDTASKKVVDVVRVGAVPKYVALTPDGKRVLVTNWCTWDLSVVDTASVQEVARIPLGGAYPRGIATAKDNTTAFVALMGSDRIVSVNLDSEKVSTFVSPGDSPRHIVLSPDYRFLYVTNNRSGNVVKVDAATGVVLGRARTGSEPRSMAISTDGGAIYVVNYSSSTMSKVRTSDMVVIDSVKTDAHPIGITYEPTRRAVWVACYGGSLLIFDDTGVLG